MKATHTVELYYSPQVVDRPIPGRAIARVRKTNTMLVVESAEITYRDKPTAFPNGIFYKKTKWQPHGLRFHIKNGREVGSSLSHGWRADVGTLSRIQE